MTRARTASYGVVTPPPLDRWIEAVLMLCVSLVQGARTTLQMWWRTGQRDWHAQSESSALPQATSGISSQGPNSTPRVMLGLVPRISVGPSRALANHPHEAINQDARHKAERDSVDVETADLESDVFVRVPGEGRGPALREAQTSTNQATSTLTRADQTPAVILNLSKDARNTADGVVKAEPARR